MSREGRHIIVVSKGFWSDVQMFKIRTLESVKKSDSNAQTKQSDLSTPSIISPKFL